MNILNALKQLRDDIKSWVTNNLNVLNAKIDEKTIPIDSELSSTSTNPVQNKVIKKAIDDIPKFSGSYNDLTNAPDISEDGTGNMVIADESGNIIFKADADGIHTTAVSINSEAAATEKYVNDAIAKIPTPDVSRQINAHNASEGAHADIRQAIKDAKEELSESIVAESDEWKVVDESGNIIFSVDASGAHTTELTLNGESAATESYVDKAIAAIPETDLSGYYTKEETNTAINDVKEELSESIVADSEEWKVVDNNGNIIFSVDAKGAHTTALTLNGESVTDIVDERVASLVDSAPDTLNTLNELANALGDDPNFATTVAAKIGKKVDKVDGKGLSTNDFTNEYKKKLDGLKNLEESDPTVPAWAKEATKPSYTAEEVGALPNTTPLFSGDYNDLTNAPDISEDGSGDLIIADANGNIIFRSNGNGFETASLSVENLTINGTSIQEMINSAIQTALSNIQKAEEVGF